MDEKKACTVPCRKDVMDDDRCQCYNMVNSNYNDGKDHGIGSVVVSFHYCSREERQELIDYLERKSWDFEETSTFVRAREET